MPFVKLDCGMLQSTTWFDRDARNVFIAALLMAEPREFTEPIPEIKTRSLDASGWSAPPGWYGFVPSSGPGIVHCAQIEFELGMAAIERLSLPEPESRSKDHGGRRMIRVDGGFLILNYQRFRDRDYTAAERQKRFRERHKSNGSVTPEPLRNGVTSRNITQAEAEADKDQTLLSEPENGSDPIKACLSPIFDYYIQKIGRHPTLTKLTPKRKAMLSARLREMWPDLIEPKQESAVGFFKAIIDKLAVSEWHHGKNDRNTEYLDLEIMFRSREKLEWWVNQK